MEVFPLINISSFEQGKGAMGHKISFFSSGNKVAMKWIQKGDVKKFIEYMHYIIGASGQSVYSQQQFVDEPAPVQPILQQTNTISAIPPEVVAKFTNSQTQQTLASDKPKWFESKNKVYLWLLLFFPAGIYALWKNSTFTNKHKIIGTSVFAVLLAAIGCNGR